ncbi:phospholipid-transporting ATPase ABCA3 isoform X2 [Parasteatoda tepidariorum]|nr:phospholipid-transporting ATPase ABCA1 isoform X1 [Parasteatoda tepidariorum]
MSSDSETDDSLKTPLLKKNFLKMGKINGFHQFVILLYKGLLLRKRHYIYTVFELVIPVLLACILPIILSETSSPSSQNYDWEEMPKSRHVNATFYSPFSPYKSKQIKNYTLELVYAPSNDVIDNFMKSVVERFTVNANYSGNITLHSENSEKDLESYCLYKRSVNKQISLIGTVFNNFALDLKQFPDSLDYKIRYGFKDFESTFNNDLKYRVNGPHIETKYQDSIFLAWQTAVEETFIQQKMNDTGKKLDYQVSMQRFPYPEHQDTRHKFNIVILVPACVCAGYLIFIINLVRRIIEEKSNGSKELLKMMGMTDFVYWISTFMNYFVIAFITTLIITIVYKVPLKNATVFMKHTEFCLLFLMLLLFMASLILFCMAFSIFFNKAVFAIITLIIFYIVTFVMYMVSYFIESLDVKYFPLPLMEKLGICTMPTGGILTMFAFVSFYEESGEGLQWYNLSERAVSPDLNMVMVLFSVIFSCFLYAVMIWYFDAVWPWQPGVPKPFYFLFMKSYWCPPKAKENDEVELVQTDPSSEFFEEEPNGISPGVVIYNLSKEFRTGLQTKLAVNNLSLTMYQGQITALLGHNGAGKTTTINILTGLFTPTKGTASINGMDILTETNNARKGLGVCPQHNVLFDTLTVEEHLKFYAAIKGTDWTKLTTEAEKVMEMLKICDKRNELAQNLSGGMKRKLSLGNAIVGGSKVLFLDEPTSGMDVEARRGVWDALLDIRYDRTIILTTHYMEEADILGDRIAIMAEGEVQCCGSPMFLKRKFGTGYHLHVVKGETFNSADTLELLRKHIPAVILEKELENEITYNLASDSGQRFGDMFEELENNKGKLGIDSCGVTVTTMEDVFLNVSNISDLKYKLAKDKYGTNGESLELEEIYGDSSETKEQQIWNQLIGLLIKRFHYSKRHWGNLIAQLVVPFLILCLCLYEIQEAGHNSKISYTPIKLDLKHVYGKTDSFYYSKQSEDNLVKQFTNTLSEKGVSVVKVDDPTKYILKYGENDLSKYLKNLLVGGAIDVYANGTNNLTAWFNGEPYHTLPMSLLLMHTAVLRSIVSDKATITLTNDPLPELYLNIYNDEFNMKERIIAMVYMPLCLAFLSASFVLVPLHERITKAKLLQLMTGLNASLYWIATFLWDFLVYFAVSLLLLIPLAIFSHHVFFGLHSEASGVSIMMLFLYGWASIPFSYILSFFFKTGNGGFSAVIALNCIIGIVIGAILITWQFSTRNFDESSAEFYVWIFRLFPAFTIASGFSNLFAIAYHNAYCDGISAEDLKISCASEFMHHWKPMFKCCKDICGTACLNQTSLITWDVLGCGRDLFMLTMDGIIFFAVLLFLETSYSGFLFRFIKDLYLKLRNSVVGNIVQSNIIEDSDVALEEQRIHDIYATHGDAVEDALMIVDLTKIFRNFYAVDHLTFGVHQEECFGLLGVNGAGKTTTFRMLTGDCFPTEGNAFTHRSSLRSDLKRFQSYLGYCPQFDALIDRLTGREILSLFARLRGMSRSGLVLRVNKLIKMIDLQAHADKQTRFYSGGNKRKLSVGIALIGSPPLILLDEPTAGVDPVSRRKIWNILSQARNYSKAAIILTSHSMEESEALCNRLAIMVNGRLRCLGPIQHLKTKYGKGYTLVIKLGKGIVDDYTTVKEIKEYIETNLDGADLKDDHQGMLQYHVVDPSVTLSKLFKLMGEMKPKFNLEDYMISDTSLEQIFLTFARAQRIS